LKDSMLVLITFTMAGVLRFLSHAEALSLFKKAFVRAGIKLRYSQGFNPRPRFSLPLPRSVGVIGEDDLLCAWVDEPESPFDVERLRLDLLTHLPEGIEVHSVRAAPDIAFLHPESATYVFEARPGHVTAEVLAKADSLTGATGLVLVRRNEQKGRTRSIDLSDFIEDVELDGNRIAVRSRITDAGAVRVAEILQLLGLPPESLASPVRRTGIQWRQRKKG